MKSTIRSYSSPFNLGHKALAVLFSGSVTVQEKIDGSQFSFGIVDGELGFNFEPDDHVIFSCKTIPTPTNIKNRHVLEEKLKKYHVRIFTDIHVSGHAAREDSRDLIELARPKHIIPAHGEHKMTHAMGDLALEMGYKEKDIHIMRDGQILAL